MKLYTIQEEEGTKAPPKTAKKIKPSHNSPHSSTEKHCVLGKALILKSQPANEPSP